MHTDSALQTQSLNTIDAEQLPLARQISVLLGNSTQLHPLVLRTMFVRAARGDTLGVILGDHHLDDAALARLARHRGFHPQEIRTRINIARAPRCHQLHHCLKNIEPLQRGWSALYMLGFLEPFLSEDVQDSLAKWFLARCLARLKEIAAGGISVLLTLASPPIESSRQEFVDMIIEASHINWQPSPLALSESVLSQLEFQWSKTPAAR